ncbi:TolB family protein, partial [Kitasatospora cystarginea]|uniref:TolB family protein n=1 Tax=Kitasatospora cystarginea TaxID=58350 RepID=UPI003CD05447
MELLAELVVDSVVPLYPVVSPDGCLVAYAVRTVGVRERLVSALWVAEAAGGSALRQLTDGSAWVGAPQWAPDSGSLYFVTGRQLHRLRLGDGLAEAVTAWRGGVAGFRPLADGRTVAMAAVDEPDAEAERRR